MTFGYTNNIPNAPNNPSVDQPLMKINTNSISGLIAVDHFGFGIANGGTHAQVQLKEVTSGTVPGPNNITFETLFASTTTIPLSGELFFARGGTNTPIQLTGPYTPSALSPGYSFIAGGILIQWGQFTGNVQNVNPNTPITFPKAFLNNCFTVQTTAFTSGDPGDNAAVSIAVNPTLSGFKWVGRSPSSSYQGFYWLAIGN